MNFLSRLSINIFIGKGILWLISSLMMVEIISMDIGLSGSIMGLEEIILFRYFKLFALESIGSLKMILCPWSLKMTFGRHNIHQFYIRLFIKMDILTIGWYVFMILGTWSILSWIGSAIEEYWTISSWRLWIVWNMTIFVLWIAVDVLKTVDV